MKKEGQLALVFFSFFFNWGWGEKTSKKHNDTEEVSAATERCGVKRMVIYSKNGSFINLHKPELLRKESYRCKQPHKLHVQWQNPFYWPLKRFTVCKNIYSLRFARAFHLQQLRHTIMKNTNRFLNRLDFLFFVFFLLFNYFCFVFKQKCAEKKKTSTKVAKIFHSDGLRCGSF